jgi:hypothetical protein
VREEYIFYLPVRDEKTSVILNGRRLLADQYHFIPGNWSSFFILKNVVSISVISYEHGKK